MIKTKVETIYDSFLSKVTDDLYVVMTEEEVKQDISSMMDAAISRFFFSKKPLEVVDGLFTVSLSKLEVEVIANLMVGEWINRQIRTVRLTELQFTGSDAKAMNTGGQLKALLDVKHQQEKETNRLMEHYHYGKTNDDGTISPSFGLSGKVL